jgi:hypothetical protein
MEISGEATRKSRFSWWRWAAGLVLLGLFIAVFLSGYMTSRPATSKTAGTSTKVGTYSNYSYVLTTTNGQTQRSAEFSPALMDDDSVVIGAEKILMQVAYGDSKDDDVQPVVEVIDEKQYITFEIDNTKTLFQLYKNSVGEVGSMKFWREKE